MKLPQVGRAAPLGPSDPLPLTRRAPQALYVHLPFCARRCPYCDFATTGLDRTLERRYLAALARELRERLPAAWRPRTIYLGGGTPGELTTPGTAELIEALSPWTAPGQEVTVEANPRTLRPRKLAALRRALGVNRVSLGAQSFTPRLLQTLGRFHRPADVTRAVQEARALGIEVLSLDLIFAVPGQRPRELRADLEALLVLEPEHVSIYGLTFEPGTAFATARARGDLRPQPEAQEARAYAFLRRRLRAAGFRHYEISNFARPGGASLHNRLYWRNAGYHGVGNGAAAHVGGVRRQNIRDVRAYVEAIEQGGARAAVASRERLEPARKLRETAYLALRTSEGIEPERFQRDTGVDPRVYFRDELRKLGELGLVEERRGRIRLSGRGVSLADAVAVELL